MNNFIQSKKGKPLKIADGSHDRDRNVIRVSITMSPGLRELIVPYCVENNMSMNRSINVILETYLVEKGKRKCRK